MRCFNLIFIVVLSLSFAFLGSCEQKPTDVENTLNPNVKSASTNKVLPQNKITDSKSVSKPIVESPTIQNESEEDENVTKPETTDVQKDTPVEPEKTVETQSLPKFANGKVRGINSIDDLDKQAIFSFAIMSDNNGDGPQSKSEFKNMVNWIKEANDKFIIGLGDHVKNGYHADFLDFIKTDKFWFDNFYPNVADGENGYYGNSQGHWGAGSMILKVNEMSKKKNVKIRENGCEYYAKIKVGDYTVHLIQLHYPDTPADDKIAFRADTKRYMVDTLNSIKKGDKDIVITSAHSRLGFFYNQLNSKERKVLVDKCDLVLSATTHVFMRMRISDYDDNEPLIVNTGSITHARGFCPNGYIQVHVLEDPLSLVVQYQNAKKDKRELVSSYYAWIKKINGEVIATSFKKPTKQINEESTK